MLMTNKRQQDFRVTQMVFEALLQGALAPHQIVLIILRVKVDID